MDKLDASVSVLICVKNVEKYIKACINSILQQSFSDFELILVDDFSNDDTSRIIKGFKDKRIRYYRNQRWLGISKSRNVCLKHAKGEFLFFTDGDCVVSKDWIEQGLQYMKDANCVGVEGKTYYVSKKYEPTFADHVSESRAGDFMTGNIAYKQSIVKKVGWFDEKYSFHEDRDFGLRLLKFGDIKFNQKMLVFVQRQILTPEQYIRRSNGLKNRVYLFKRFHDKSCMVWRFVDPVSLGIILFPPLVFASFFGSKFKSSDDFKLVPFKYVHLLFARLQLWKESAKERVLLI